MEPRNRRLRSSAKACHSCRQRKVRCQYDSGMTKCRACYRRSSSCIPSTAQMVVAEQSATLPQFENDPTAFDPFADFFGLSTPPLFAEDAHHDTVLPPLLHHLSSAFDPSPPDTDPFSLLSCFSLPRSLVSNPNSSSFSVFSAEGKEWLQKAVGSEVFSSDLLSPAAWSSDVSFGGSTCPSRPPQQSIALPPKDIARSLLLTYFESCNSFVPTFQEQEFMLWFELEYPIGPESSGAWACLNATLALASLLDKQSEPNAWLFWKNAALSWESFMTQAPSLCSAQALVTMTLYLLGTFHNNACSTMVSMAIRILSGMPPQQGSLSQQFQFVRMATQALDIDHALQVGVPPTALGGVDHTANPSCLQDPNVPFDCYPFFCRLLELKEEVYRQLYSIAAQDKDDYEAVTTIGDLDSQLEQWKNDIPEQYRPGHPKARDVIENRVSDSVLQLHITYYNCVLVIHRRLMSYRSNPTASTRLAGSSHVAYRSANPRALISTQLCADAARASLRLVKYIPMDNPFVRGVMLHSVIFALKILVTLTIQEPNSPRARADILLMRNLEDALSSLPVTQDERSIRNLIDCCTHYRDTAEQAINDAISRKRPQDYDRPESAELWEAECWEKQFGNSGFRISDLGHSIPAFAQQSQQPTTINVTGANHGFFGFISSVEVPDWMISASLCTDNIEIGLHSLKHGTISGTKTIGENPNPTRERDRHTSKFPRIPRRYLVDQPTSHPLQFI
ncbi:hypothetical protein BJY01DRAFT_237031 [Aspergillus pseudoustus]|uniref:Zn(2)-C6 fungal-type domain-containing protein n=1 Tax=Aspergillus pseudoustus TaxID=1810923 RepID=A0ABR4JI02_9EURO